MDKSFVITLFLVLSLLPAHAGKLDSIKSVRIDDEVGKPGHFIYYGTTDSVMTSLFGIGAFIGGLGPDKEGAEIEAKMRNAGFRIDCQILSDFRAQSSKNNLFASGGSHVLRLDLTEYGIGVAPTGFKRLKPVLEGQITITDSSHKQVYFLRKSVSDMDNVVKGQTYEEYRGNIQLLIRDMKILSAKLAERFAEAIAKDRKSEGSSSKKSSSKSGSPSKSSSHRSR